MVWHGSNGGLAVLRFITVILGISKFALLGLVSLF